MQPSKISSNCWRKRSQPGKQPANFFQLLSLPAISSPRMTSSIKIVPWKKYRQLMSIQTMLLVKMMKWQTFTCNHQRKENRFKIPQIKRERIMRSPSRTRWSMSLTNYFPRNIKSKDANWITTHPLSSRNLSGLPRKNPRMDCLAALWSIRSRISIHHSFQCRTNHETQILTKFRKR